MTDKFTAEWIAEQRAIQNNAAEEYCKLQSRILGIEGTLSYDRTIAEAKREAFTNYPAALDEIEWWQAEVAALKQMMKYWYEQDEKPAGLLEVIRGCLPREEREE